jgi:hypothetical protein
MDFHFKVSVNQTFQVLHVLPTRQLIILLMLAIVKVILKYMI